MKKVYLRQHPKINTGIREDNVKTVYVAKFPFRKELINNTKLQKKITYSLCKLLGITGTVVKITINMFFKSDMN